MPRQSPYITQTILELKVQRLAPSATAHPRETCI